MSHKGVAVRDRVCVNNPTAPGGARRLALFFFPQFFCFLCPVPP